MTRTLALRGSLAFLIGLTFVLPAAAQVRRIPRWRLGSQGMDRQAPSTYGYGLNDISTGYYGGGSYTHYYAYGRGGIADFPEPLPWRGPPPDYRGHVIVPHYVPTSPAPVPILAAAPQKTEDAPAQIFVELPADAEVWLDGEKTKQTGSQRWFASPPLKSGKQFVYELRARWKVDGQDVEETDNVVIAAGEEVRVRFPKASVKESPKAFPLAD